MADEYSADDIRVIDIVSMNFVELISAIEKKPFLLPERNIMNLDAFICGWFAGRGFEADKGIMSRFQIYVENRFEVTSTHGWARIIYQYSSDSHEALNHFFELFNEFLEVDEI